MPTPVVPPVDLNQPVTNPALAAALTALTQTDTPETRQRAVELMQTANYLMATLTDEVQTELGDTPGQGIIKAGSRIKVLLCDDGRGGQLLPLFTDWEAIRRWATNPDITGTVLPAADAWSFALAGNTYSGIIINPANQGIVLWRDALAHMPMQK